MQARIDANRQALAGENLTDEERKALASEADKYEAELKKTVLVHFYYYSLCFQQNWFKENRVLMILGFARLKILNNFFGHLISKEKII
jgi:hypothetical protein